MTQTQDYVQVKINGITVDRCKLMTAQHGGFCVYHRRKFAPGQQIAFKHRDSLTLAQKNAIFGGGQVYHLTVIWPLEQNTSDTKLQPAKKWDWPLSEYQNTIWDRVRTTNKHVFIEALAGCAKTSTLIRVCKELSRLGITRGKDCIYLAFNTSIRKEVYPDLQGTGVRALTTHSFLLNRMLKNAYPNLDTEKCLNKYLVDDYFMKVLCADVGCQYTDSGKRIARQHKNHKMMSGVLELVGLLKNWAVLPEFKNGRWVFSEDQRQRVIDLVDEYRIVLEEDFTEEDYTDYALKIATMCCPMPGEELAEIDFNDMLWLPLVLKLPFPKVDLVLTDESQDFNACQLMVLHFLVQQGTRIIVVGDIKQALYRFRGADSRAFHNILAMLQQTNRGVDVCELPINYRCDKAIIEHARQWTPNLQGFSTKEGIVQDVNFNDAIEKALQKDGQTYAFLCRTNSPLVVAAYYTMSQILQTAKPEDRKTVCILGRDTALGPLRNLIYDLCGRNPTWDKYTDRISDRKDSDGRVLERGLLSRLNEYKMIQTAKLGCNPKYAMKLDEIISNCKCLEVVASTIKDDSVKTMMSQMDSLFVDEVGNPAETIVFSSIHKAKGLEWDVVRIIRPDLLPHPLAMPNDDGSWSDDQQVEENCCYVAATRARHDLGYVTNWPFEGGQKSDLTSVGNVQPPAIKPEYDPLVRVPEEKMTWSPPPIKSPRAQEVQPPVVTPPVAQPKIPEFVDDGEPF